LVAERTPGYVLAHAALGCALSAAEGEGCAGGAIGGAASALVAPLVRDALYDGSETVTTADNGNGTLTQTTSYNNSAFNAITAGIATLTGGLAAGMAGANAQAGATWAGNEVLNNTLSAKEKQLLTHAYTFEMPGAVVAQSDAAQTLADLQVAQKDPNLSPTERNYFTSATLSVYQAGIQAGVLSADNVGPLVSAAIGSMAFSGGGEGPLPTGASRSNVLPTTSGSRTAVDLGAPTNSNGTTFEDPSQVVQSRIDTLRNAIPANSQGRITMAAAVVQDADGNPFVLVGTSEDNGYLRPGVRNVLQPGDVVVPGTGHAEADIVSYANRNGLTVVDIGATRPVCSSCQATIAPTGANISTPLKKSTRPQ